MTSTVVGGERRTPGAAGQRRPVPGPVALLRGLLARPLTSYYLLLACVGLLLVIGLVMVFSATSLSGFAKNHNAFAGVFKQGLFAIIGFGAFWFCQRLPVRTFRGVAKLSMIVAFTLMIVLDLLGFAAKLRAPANAKTIDPIHLGPIYADQLWLHVGSIQLQPVELAKLAMVLWGAKTLVDKGRAIVHLRELMLPLFPVAGAMFALVGYGDLGSMLCLLVAFIGLLWAAGVRKRVFAGMFAIALAAVAGLILMPGKAEYRMARIAVFLDPSKASPDDAYQHFQGLYAIANGGWFGVGLGEGHLKWGRLPNGHNDFIFAVIAEELGVIGCFIVVALFGVLAYTGLRIARRVPDPFRRLVAAAITSWFIGQAVINIGGVLGLLPITGLPLPFISDGGTALVVALTAAGILLSFARAESDAARALHARPPRRWVRLLWAPLPPLPRSHSGPGPDGRTGRSS